MRNNSIFVLLLAGMVVLSLASCDLLGLGQKGLVTFDSEPEYSFGVITFSVSVQSGGAMHGYINVPWEIRDGNDIVEKGTAVADQNPLGLGIMLVSDMVTVEIDEGSLSGNQLDISLDPDNKVTSEEYTTPDYVELYKEYTIYVP